MMSTLADVEPPCVVSLGASWAGSGPCELEPEDAWGADGLEAHGRRALRKLNRLRQPIDPASALYTRLLEEVDADLVRWKSAALWLSSMEKEMGMRLRIEGVDMSLRPRLLGWIAAQVASLNTPEQDIGQAHVVLAQYASQQSGWYEARIALILTGKTIRVTRSGETVREAMIVAIEATTKALEKYRIRQLVAG